MLNLLIALFGLSTGAADVEQLGSRSYQERNEAYLKFARNPDKMVIVGLLDGLKSSNPTTQLQAKVLLSQKGWNPDLTDAENFYWLLMRQSKDTLKVAQALEFYSGKLSEWDIRGINENVPLSMLILDFASWKGYGAGHGEEDYYGLMSDDARLWYLFTVYDSVLQGNFKQ